MKKLFDTNPSTLFKFLTIVGAICLLMGCNKVEGPGGTSTITGTVQSQNHEGSRSEITEIIFSTGLSIEHGDYWILNNPLNEEQFYIYYDNPEWVSDADPSLAGRTGIAVEFTYSDSNVEIAENTMEELSAVAEDQFTIARNVDILTISNKLKGETSDADNVTCPFEFNTSQQGRNASLSALNAAIDEKVYLIYGDQTHYGELTRTGGDGEYQFTNLTDGSYTVYSISKDTVSGGTTKILQTIEIAEKKSVTNAPALSILY